MTATEIDPNDFVSAIFHKVGSGVRVANDEKLFGIFNQAAEKLPDELDEFAWHPVYHDNEILSSTLRIMDAGGTLIRENASTAYFRCSQRLEGKFGESTYNSLVEAGMGDIIDEIASRIKQVYGQH